MPTASFYQQGVTEVGHIVGGIGGTDTTWGETTEAGAVLQMSTQADDLYGGQSKMIVDTAITRTDLQLQIGLDNVALQTLAYAAGIDASADFTGDLTLGTPTAEVLTLTETGLGSQYLSLYITGPGPSSTRRLEAGRCRARSFGGGIQWAKQHATFTSTWGILPPTQASEGTNPATITDAV